MSKKSAEDFIESLINDFFRDINCPADEVDTAAEDWINDIDDTWLVGLEFGEVVNFAEDAFKDSGGIDDLASKNGLANAIRHLACLGITDDFSSSVSSLWSGVMRKVTGIEHVYGRNPHGKNTPDAVVDGAHAYIIKKPGGGHRVQILVQDCDIQDGCLYCDGVVWYDMTEELSEAVHGNAVFSMVLSSLDPLD